MSGFDNSGPTADHSSYALLRRLFGDFGYRYRSRYAIAFIFMAISAACTALCAYLIGEAVTRAFSDRDLGRVVELAILAFALFGTKGLATYVQAVVMARIGNAIIAENQRRMISRLLDQGMAFFELRHS